MANSDVKLVGAFPSPFVIRVRIALNLKSVTYDFLEEKFGPILYKSDLLLKSNPVYKKIPVLIHGEKPICESLIIVQYIDEVWSSCPSILASDPHDRAMQRFWACYIDDKWFPSFSAIGRVEGEEARNAVIGQATEGLALLEDAFAKCSKGKSFFGGDTIGYLDIALGCFLGWLRVNEKMNNLSLINETKTPGLHKWARSFCSHAAVKDIIPETEKLIEIAKMIFANSKAIPSN